MLLTGASAGIGRRFASVLHEAGARVAMVARRQSALEAVARDLPGTVPIVADLANDDPSEIHDRVVDEIGPIDILVNNAAFIAAGVKAEAESYDEIMQTLRVNLVAPIGLAQAVYPEMRRQGNGVIINVTSIGAHVGIGRFPQAVYAATKGGLTALTREWAAQWSRYGIRVNAIAPGFIETEITQDVIHTDNVQAWIRRNSLIQRHGTPEDIDGALLYLTSDASSYVTGQTIIVDGGWTAR